MELIHGEQLKREKHSLEMVCDEGTILVHRNIAFSMNMPLEGKILLL